MSETEERVGDLCCYMCHRYRPAAKMDETGRRCADREACLKATARAAPVKVPKGVLKQQFGNVIE